MRYTWVEKGIKRSTTSAFLRWRPPEPPYLNDYYGVFDQKRNFLVVPLSCLTQETREMLPPLPTQTQEPDYIYPELEF